MSRQIDICKAITKTLQETFKEAPGVRVVAEDSCDPSAEVQKALGTLGVLVLVAASGHRRKPGTGAS